jgi:putative hydrolase of HD superfamily
MDTDSYLLDRIGQPDDVPERLAAQIKFIVEVDRSRPCSGAAHWPPRTVGRTTPSYSWHLALMVLVLAEYADEPIDSARTAELVFVHDLVEVYAGDTFLYDDAAAKDQQEREQAAADRLLALRPADQTGRFRALWNESEARGTPEARFAKAMDWLQPLLLNLNNRGGTCRTPDVTEADVRHRKSGIGAASGELWTYAQRLIEAGAQRGWVPRTPEQ